MLVRDPHATSFAGSRLHLYSASSTPHMSVSPTTIIHYIHTLCFTDTFASFSGLLKNFRLSNTLYLQGFDLTIINNTPPHRRTRSS